MTKNYPHEYEQVLHQIHADVFLERLGEYIKPDGEVPDKVTSDLSDLVRRLLMEASSPSIDRKDIQKLLKDGEIRDQLKQSIRNLIKSQSKDET